MKIRFFVLLFAIFSGLATVNGMTTFVIQNKMDNDLYIENFSTKGSVVFNDIQLAGSCLERNDSTSIQIGIVSLACKQKDNFVILNLFNKQKDDYERVMLTWGDEGIAIRDKLYVVKNFYRLTQHLDEQGRILFTFYEDTEKVVDLLKSEASLRLKVNKGTQQKQLESTIEMYSGLLPEDWEIKR